MSIHLHVFMVSKNPERCIAFEFYVDDKEKNTSQFDIELVVWGMERDQDLLSTVELLKRRGWHSKEIDGAINRARTSIRGNVL